MQNQSQTSQRPDFPDDQSGVEQAPVLKKETKGMTALLWPALTVLAIAIILILVFSFR